MIGDATEFRPVAEGANRGLFAGRENAASAEANDVDELRIDANSGIGGRVHAPGAVSTACRNEFAGTGLNCLCHKITHS